MKEKYSFLNIINIFLDAEIDFFVTTEKDFGSVGCRAENSIGIQEQPCLFLLHPSIR